VTSDRDPTPRRLHIGPGARWVAPDPRWLAVDIDPKRGDLVVDFNADPRLELADGSCDAIYASHVFEHMSLVAAPAMMRECWRVLVPGGVLRIIVPDARRSIEAYLAADSDFPLFARRRARAARKYGKDYTLFECLREDFLSLSGQPDLLGDGALAHQNAWDFDAMRADLVRAGFSPDGVGRSQFQRSTSAAFDFEGSYEAEANEWSRSLYVEAVRER
jgi:SAM-dependent methyltransferase